MKLQILFLFFFVVSLTMAVEVERSRNRHSKKNKLIGDYDSYCRSHCVPAEQDLEVVEDGSPCVFIQSVQSMCHYHRKKPEVVEDGILGKGEFDMESCNEDTNCVYFNNRCVDKCSNIPCTTTTLDNGTKQCTHNTLGDRIVDGVGKAASFVGDAMGKVGKTLFNVGTSAVKSAAKGTVWVGGKTVAAINWAYHSNDRKITQEFCLGQCKVGQNNLCEIIDQSQNPTHFCEEKQNKFTQLNCENIPGNFCRWNGQQCESACALTCQVQQDTQVCGMKQDTYIDPATAQVKFMKKNHKKTHKKSHRK